MIKKCILTLIIASLLLAGCSANDPIRDTIYYAGEPPITLVGDGKVWIEIRTDLDFESVRANGKPTYVKQGVFGGFSLPIWNDGVNADEELYVDTCVPGRWDGESDFYIHIYCWVDTAQVDDTDTFKIWTQYENYKPGVTNVFGGATAQSHETTTGVCDQYKSFIVTLQIGWDVGRHPVVEEDDIFAIRIRRMSTVGGTEIDGEVVIDHVAMVFQCDKIGNPEYD